MTDRDSMEFNDFRVVTSSSVSRKGSTTGGLISTGGQGSNRYRFTLGEVSSTNITLDVNVGAGWTRIRLKEVPKFIVHAFNMITKYGMEVDGIFRKEGNSARLNRAEVQNIYKGQCDIPNDYTVIDVCTMVKRFLRDLKPPLLDSDEFRQRLFKRACQARISNCFVLTRDEMADMCYSEDVSKERQTALLSDIHFSTLGYVMRQLSRISAHCDQHKMSVENLAVVLVGSVFGDGIHNPKKNPQIRRGSQDDILAQKKQDMNVHVAAVKLLITNANLIGVRRDPYVTSNAMLRSSSAMPRCMSSGYETGSSDADCVSTKTGSTMKSSDVGAVGPAAHIYRRDSEAAHKIVTARKKNEQMAKKKKRSASFLPSFRDIRHRFTNMKRAKSPSPERLMTGHTTAESSSKITDTSSSDQNCEPQSELIHRKKVARNESNTMSTGSTASGRQSRSQQSRRGNTNAAPKGGNSSRNPSLKPTIAKLFEAEPIVSAGALRRLSASDQNSDAIRFAKHRGSNEQMSVTEFLMSEHEREKESTKLQKRNTMILGETTSKREGSGSKHTNRRHTAPINNNRLRRNRPNTVGAGLPHRKDSFLMTSSSMEEKENQADCETDDTTEHMRNQAQWLLEQKAMEARSRRVNRKQKAAARNISTESMTVLNGTMAATTSAVCTKPQPEAHDNALSEDSPIKKCLETKQQEVVLRKDLEEKKKQFCDMATSPMIITTPKKIIPQHENGHAWVGTKQVINVTPSPSLVRRQSRARLSYSKATESPIDMPSPPYRRESSPLMSPILKHVAVTNNSPPAQMVTKVSPRSSLSTPKSHGISPLVLKLENTPPPPIPLHSPPYLTPQVSKSSVEESKRVSPSSFETEQKQRRPPTPPSRPKMPNPFSPKLPVRSATIDNGFELPTVPPGEGLFKLPQLPKKISASSAQHHHQQQLSPLARQQLSMSTLSVPNRANLRETKSIDASETAPLRSAPLTSSSGQLSPHSSDYFEFGKYTSMIRSAKDEFALPSRKHSVEPRPSVAIIRNNNCGLVRSRVNHFQEIEQMQRNETSLSGRISAMSQLSLRSNDTHPSSSDRYSDVSDSRHNLTSSDSMDTTPTTPTATNSRVSYDPVHHF